MRKFLKLTLLPLCFVLTLSILRLNVHAASISIERFGGNDRYDTAVKISENNWSTSDTVILVSGKNFPDALSAAPLSGVYNNAPILLVNGTSLDSNISSELLRLQAKNAFIIGGTTVISDAIINSLTSMGITSTRIFGSDRYETSLKIAKLVGINNGIVITSGENFPDALSISSVASAKKMPIILTNKNSFPSSVQAFIDSNKNSNFYVIGGTGVISDSVLTGLPNVTRLAGNNRYLTNAAVLDKFKNDFTSNNVYISTGQNFADALGGSPAAAKSASPIVLIDNTSYTQNSVMQSKINSISSIKVLGGTGVISDNFVQNLINTSSTSGKIVLGYSTKYYSGDTSSYNSIANYGSNLNEVATFTYASDGSGNLSGIAPDDQITLSISKNIKPFAVVTNGFNADVAKQLLESSTNRQNLINNLLAQIKAHNYAGVNVDIEGVYYYDRSYYTQFMNELYSALKPQGYMVSVAVPAKTSDSPSNSWNGAFNYGQIAKYCDEMVLMTYDEHWSGGDAGPIASIGWVQSVVNYTLTQVPKEKIMLGLAAYAYDWSSAGGSATSYGVSTAYTVAANHGVSVQWDSASQTPYYYYKDSSGFNHSVWFENGTSIGYKLDICNTAGLRGVAIWRLGLENSDYWTTIQNKLK